MAQPSSSHRERERERERSHHHHRTISSTTLLLVLSLILAVLAVMLSLPASQGFVSGGEGGTGLWGYLSPKRSQTLVAREHAVAIREAEVAHREAELLAGAPGGVTTMSCPPVPSALTTPATPPPEIIFQPPVQTVIKEVVREVEGLSPPGWWKDVGIRVEEVLDREARVSDREKEVGRREEGIGRRETDVTRREAWIMEQLIALGNEPGQTVEEEIIYESPPAARRKPKEIPHVPVVETIVQTVTQTIPPVTQVEIFTETQTVTLPPVAHTRVAARPSPEEYLRSGRVTEKVRPTTAVEIVEESLSLPTPEVVAEELEEIYEEFDDRRGKERTVTVVQRPKQTRRPTQSTQWW